MPTEMSSWADEIDETDTSLVLPAPSEKWVGNQKITTEYTHNEDGKKVIIKLETPTGHLVWTVLGRPIRCNTTTTFLINLLRFATDKNHTNVQD